MSETEITSDDIEAAYRVLEYLRDEWAAGNYEENAIENAHYLLQKYEECEYNEVVK